MTHGAQQMQRLESVFRLTRRETPVWTTATQHLARREVVSTIRMLPLGEAMPAVQYSSPCRLAARESAANWRLARPTVVMFLRDGC